MEASEESPAISGDHSISPTIANTSKPKKLTLVPLIFLIYFEVAGGPYGEEMAVQAAGPFFAILGFLIFPFIWCIPEALVTAELSTTFPGNGGFVIWADQAFGPFWGSLMGTWKFLSVVINIASFPVLCIEYIQNLIPGLNSGWSRYISILVSTLVLSFVNCTGLKIVGYAAVVLALVSLFPFVLMTLIALPKLHPNRWISMGQKGVAKDWNLYLNTLFWNLNFMDSVSTLAGEVDKPQKTFPLALSAAVIFICVSYLIPLMAATGAVSVDQSEWQAGFMAEAAEIVAGKWLKYFMEIGAVLSSIGMFEAQLSSSAYQLLGMAEIGMVPRFFGVKFKLFDTPWPGILAVTVISLVVSYMNLTEIISSANFLYGLGMLLEFASFVWLRRKLSAIERPYRVPLTLPWLVIMCLVPCGFLIIVMVTATKPTYIVSGIVTVTGILWYFLMKLFKAKKLFKFANGD